MLKVNFQFHFRIYKLLNILKISVLSISIFVIFQNSIAGQTLKSGNVMSNQEKLQLDAKILSERYCTPMDLVLNLQLTFTNRGKEPIILDKMSDVIYEYQEVPIDKRAKKHLPQKRIISPMLLGQEIRYGEDPSEEAFIILDESESYSIKILKIIDVYDGTDTTEDFLHPGKYNLILKMKTWYYRFSLLPEYSEKWKEKGFLWGLGVTSQPIEFKVLRNKNISTCSTEN